MPDPRRQRPPPSYRAGIGGAYAWIGIAMGAVSTAKLVLDLASLPLATVVAGLFRTYAVVFHTIFDVVFFWLPFAVPGWAKDLVIAYVIVGGAAQKAELVTVLADWRHPWIVLHLYRNSRLLFWLRAGARLAFATLAWPVWLWLHRGRPYLVMGLGSHGPGRVAYTKRPPRRTEHGQEIYFGDVRLIILIRLLSILVGAAAILVANYAFSI
ncbi:hypothetical protein [Roseomonas sp. AR75]|uniref:hypothetical protein n=1 Tax=Roseomonas sp. AR75 TaxID=2562311 RepID=UPI0010C0103E|nr:hypothetical protein [Roseomonas sp. AR75]